MAEVLGTQRNAVEAVPHHDGSLAGSHSGQYGVSDDRRAQLSQLERDAGVQHEAPDESVSQRPGSASEQNPGLGEVSGAARPGDRH